MSAATLEPTHPARPYHRAPRGVHFHALRANFPCVFALSLYECEDHARRYAFKKFYDLQMCTPVMFDGTSNSYSMLSACARMWLPHVVRYLPVAERISVAMRGRTPIRYSRYG